MGIRIFEVNTDEPRGETDIVGRLRSGYQVDGQPRSLQSWRITAGDPDTLTEVATALGATITDEPVSWATKGFDSWEVFTDLSEVGVTVEQIKADMALWGQAGKPVRTCDGIQQETGQPCVCPASVRERKDAAKAGWGCKPNIGILFTLTGHEELGKFRFNSGSWDLAENIAIVETALELNKAPTVCTLGLDHVEYTTKDGQARSFTKPLLTVGAPQAAF